MNNVVNYPIDSITPFTLLDYPDKTACILWFAGCNMRCVYCYNPGIVHSQGKFDYDHALSFLKKRKNLLDGVVLSGGECTTHKGISDFIQQVRDLNMKIKLDTNGSNPLVMDELILQQKLDYVALDFKAPKEKFHAITKSKLFNRFEKSLDLLVNSDVNFEIRTTVHNQLLSKEELYKMIDYLILKGYTGKYYIQQFINDTPTIGNMGFSLNTLKQADFNSCKLEVVLRN